MGETAFSADHYELAIEIAIRAHQFDEVDKLLRSMAVRHPKRAAELVTVIKAGLLLARDGSGGADD